MRQNRVQLLSFSTYFVEYVFPGTSNRRDHSKMGGDGEVTRVVSGKVTGEGMTGLIKPTWVRNAASGLWLTDKRNSVFF